MDPVIEDQWERLQPQCHSIEGAAAAIEIVLGEYVKANMIPGKNGQRDGTKYPRLMALGSFLAADAAERYRLDSWLVLAAVIERLAWEVEGLHYCLDSQSDVIESLR